MAMYNMVGCNTSRTAAGGVALRAGQFRGYKPAVKIQQNTYINEKVIINTKQNSCCAQPALGYVQPQVGWMDALPAFMTGLASLLGIFKKDDSTPVEDGKGGKDPVTPPTTPQPEVVHKETVADDPEIEQDPKDVYDAKITPKTVEQEGATHTVKHGECWYDVLDAKYPGISGADRKAAMRELKKANGMTNFNSADMPRKMYLPNEIKVGDNVYKLNNDNSVVGTVKEFTEGGMYNAQIPTSQSTTYDVTGTKNGEDAYSASFDSRDAAVAARDKWLSQNEE